MEQAWLVVNAFLRSGTFRETENALLAAARRAGLRMRVMTNDSFIAADCLDFSPPAALFFDKDIRLAQRMEAAGMRLFNPARAIAVCDDKTATALAITEAGLPQPETILCPKTFPGVGYPDTRFLDGVINSLGFPMVVKEGHGSFGNQVYLLSDRDALLRLLNRIDDKPLLFQRFISESAGHDLRVYVVGGAVAAAIQRENRKGDFRANIEHGGTASAYAPTREEASLAVAACRACGADFAGVDLLVSDHGPLVCEVNSNAHFLGLTAATGVNPADHIVSLVKNSL